MSRRALIGMVAIAGLAVGCGGGDGGGDGLGTGDDYTVAGALAELPASVASEGNIEITTADLNAAGEAAGVERPDDAGDVDALIQWIGPLTGVMADETTELAGYVHMAQVFNPQRVQEVGEFHDALGWSIIDADSFVEYSNLPTSFSVVAGPYDDETLSADLIELGDGVMTDKEGEDGSADVENITAVDDLGRPVRLAQADGRIAASFQTPSVEEWLDDPDDTLADDEDLVAVAEALDDAGAYSAYLIRPESGFASTAMFDTLGDDVDVDELRERYEEELESLPPSAFNTVGIGWSTDDEGAVITLAYQHGSEDAASENAEVLEQVFTDGVSFRTSAPITELYDLVGVEADGTVVTATVRPAGDRPPNVAVQGLLARDIPFVHA